MKKIIYLFLILALPLSAFAQTASNVVATQVGNTIEITYDLDQPAQVTLLLSLNGGATYSPTPKALTGDVGFNIQPGHKKIIWNLFSDDHNWEIERARFKVVALNMNKEFTLGRISFTMIYVEGGTFTMGATSEQGRGTDKDEKPAHQVTLSDYYIGQTEVTQDLWEEIMGDVPLKKYNGSKYPVSKVSWEDCQKFIDKLNIVFASQLSGKRFALPTEAQWEYAARGGKKSKGYKYSGSNTVGNVAWYKDNSDQLSHPVGTKSANELGIYDMSGNVREWCSDRFSWYTREPQTNPTGGSTDEDRICRGGSWLEDEKSCRVSYRHYEAPDKKYSNIGLRLVIQ